MKSKVPKIFKIIGKATAVFLGVVVIYTFIYQFQVSSQQKVSVDNTFVASDEEIAKAEARGSNVIENGTIKLTEGNIDKSGFYIRIDKLLLFKPVVENVDPRYRDEYVESWESGVSHGKFTAIPDQIGNVYLFAHAVSDIDNMNEENAWFTEIDLLEEGDSVIIYYKVNKYAYSVSKIFAVSPTATGIYTGVSPVPKVTLQTCGPPRGSLKSRLIVEALQISVEPF